MGPGIAAVIAATLSLAGCTVGPRYKAPEVTPTAQFKSQVGASEAKSIADLPWWQVFNDKALQGLVSQALASNYDLQVAAARVEQARALVGVAESDRWPQVGYQGIAARQQSFVPLEATKNITYNSIGVALGAAWELDLWGRVRSATESARQSLFAQEDVRRGVMLSLVSDVAASYFSLIEFDRELAIARESAASYRQTLDLFTQRYNAGNDTKLAVSRAQAAFDSSGVDIARLTRAVAQQENVLSVLLGGYPGQIARGQLLTDQVAPETPVGLTTDVLQRRPDIRQAEHVMMGANAEIGVAAANYFPVIGISALIGGQAPHAEDLFKGGWGIWGIGADLAGPIFQGGRLRNTYHAREAFWNESIAHYKNTIINAFRETSDALTAQQTLVDQRAALESQVFALRDSVDLSLERYGAGRANYFEVLDAQQQLFPSEAALAQTQRDQLLAVVNLYKALGGGWNLKDEDWSQPK